MDVRQAIKTRRSIREYQDKTIAKELLIELIDAARFAPTARGVQPWEFIVITRKDTLEKIASFTDNGKFAAKAPCCIAVFCSDTKYYLEDGCAATENLLLAAASLGIGSCWVAGDKKPYCTQINDLLGVPSAYKLVSLIALGYPLAKNELRIKNKRSLDEVLHWERF